MCFVEKTKGSRWELESIEEAEIAQEENGEEKKGRVALQDWESKLQPAGNCEKKHKRGRRLACLIPSLDL